MAIQEQCRAALANCNETVIPRMPRFTNIGGAPLPAWRATTAEQRFSSCRFGTAISSRRLPSGRPNAALTSDGAKLDQVSFAATPQCWRRDGKNTQAALRRASAHLPHNRRLLVF